MKHLARWFILSIYGLCYAGEYFQQDVTYDIEVTLNDTDRTLTAFEKLTYKNNSRDTLDFIWFHLWPNAYKSDSSAMAKQFIRLGSNRFKDVEEKNRGYIDSLNFSVDGIVTNWEYHSEWIDVAKIFLPKPLLPEKTIIIETPFFVKLPKVVSRLGHTGKHFEITQWYPKPAVYDKDGWHPMPYLNMGEFYSEFGRFDVKITLPENYRIMATGDMVNADKELAWLDSLAIIGDSLKDLSKKELKKYTKKKKTKKKRKKKKNQNKDSVKVIPNKTIHFRQENVHDFAWFSDPNWIVQKGELWLDDSTHQITLWSMYLPKNAWLWRKSIEYLHDSGLWYSRFYGDYPYNHISAVDGDMSAGGGMEYPNITVISRSGSEDLLEYVIMHEVGHNWFYGILGSNERDHPWMDEGLNEYTGIRYWGKKYADRKSQFVFIDEIQNKLRIGKNLDMAYFQYSGYSSTATIADVQPLDISSDDNYAYRNYSQNYSKVAVMMRYLQHYLGEEKMNLIMQDYYETWKFGHPGPDDFILFFNKHLNEDINWFFDNVIDSTTYIDYKVSKRGGQYLLENMGTFNSAVELAFYDKNKNEIKRIWMKPTEKISVLDTPDDCYRIIIDPEQFMPDINRTNNVTRRGLKTHFVYDRPTYYDIDLNIAPWLFTYNQYNGFSPGLSLFYGGGSGFDGKSIMTNILYDFKNQRPVGGLQIDKGFNNLWSLNSGSLSLGIRSLEGRKGLKLSFKGKKKNKLQKSPESYMRFNIYYHNIQKDAVNPKIYDHGNIIASSASFQKRWIPNSSNNYSLISKIWFGPDYCLLSASASINIRFTKKMKTNIKLTGGTFLISKYIPRQYRNYLSGSIDPDFDSYVIDRTGTSSVSKIIENIYHHGGIRGLNILDPYQSTDKGMWTIRIDQSVPKLPANIFLDFAGGKGFSEKYYVAGGLKLWFIIVPLYQSWEPDHKTPDSLEWIKERTRISIPLLDIQIG